MAHRFHISTNPQHIPILSLTFIYDNIVYQTLHITFRITPLTFNRYPHLSTYLILADTLSDTPSYEYHIFCARCTLPTPPIHYGITNSTTLERFLFTELTLTYIHKVIKKPKHIHRLIQYLKHKHTICLKSSTINGDTFSLYPNETVINQTL